MGSIKKDILGGVSGKVGTIVGVHWKSNYYIRAHAAKVSNPRTPKQQEQRGKFAMAFSFLRIIKPFIRIGYKEFTGEKSAYNAAMSYMLKKVILNKGKEKMFLILYFLFYYCLLWLYNLLLLYWNLCSHIHHLFRMYQ